MNQPSNGLDGKEICLRVNGKLFDICFTDLHAARRAAQKLSEMNHRVEMFESGSGKIIACAPNAATPFCRKE